MLLFLTPPWWVMLGTNNNFHHCSITSDVVVWSVSDMFTRNPLALFIIVLMTVKKVWTDNEYYFSVKKIKGRKVSAMKAKLCSNLSEVDCSDVGCKIIKQVDVGVILCVRVGGRCKKVLIPVSQCCLDN